MSYNHNKIYARDPRHIENAFLKNGDQLIVSFSIQLTFFIGHRRHSLQVSSEFYSSQIQFEIFLALENKLSLVGAYFLNMNAFLIIVIHKEYQ